MDVVPNEVRILLISIIAENFPDILQAEHTGIKSELADQQISASPPPSLCPPAEWCHPNFGAKQVCREGEGCWVRQEGGGVWWDIFVIWLASFIFQKWTMRWHGGKSQIEKQRSHISPNAADLHCDALIITIEFKRLYSPDEPPPHYDSLSSLLLTI